MECILCSPDNTSPSNCFNFQIETLISETGKLRSIPFTFVHIIQFVQLYLYIYIIMFFISDLLQSSSLIQKFRICQMKPQIKEQSSLIYFYSDLFNVIRLILSATHTFTHHYASYITLHAVRNNFVFKL